MILVIRPFFASKLFINRPILLSLLFLLSCTFHPSQAQDSSWVTVHFIYGSKPKKACKEEYKWFGGIHGGHVGIEYDTGKVMDFAPEGKFHYFERKKACHSAYTLRSMSSFWQTFGGADSAHVKAMSIRIQISADQRNALDSIVEAYSSKVPYDYAFFGMRCAAASYDILDEIGVMPARSHLGTWFHIFYPKRLRIRLIKKAKKQDWQVWKKEGSACRIWEKD